VDTLFWLTPALVVVDMIFVGVLYFQMRAYPRLDRRAFHATVAGMLGFVFAALLTMDGIFRIIQLAAIAIIICITWLQHQGRLPGQKLGVE
jgi:hypothetical protein